MITATTVRKLQKNLEKTDPIVPPKIPELPALTKSEKATLKQLLKHIDLEIKSSMKNRYLFTKKLCTNTFIYLGAIYDNRGCTISESDKKLVSERIENFHFILVDSDTGNNSPIIKHCVDKLEKSGYVVKWQRLNCISCSERDDYGCYQTRDIAYEVGLNIEWPETKV